MRVISVRTNIGWFIGRTKELPNLKSGNFVTLQDICEVAVMKIQSPPNVQGANPQIKTMFSLSDLPEGECTIELGTSYLLQEFDSKDSHHALLQIYSGFLKAAKRSGFLEVANR